MRTERPAVAVGASTTEPAVQDGAAPSRRPSMSDGSLGARCPYGGEMVFGVPAHVGAPTQCVPTAGSRLGADGYPASSQESYIECLRVSIGDGGFEVCEIPFDRTARNGLEVDESRLPAARQHVETMG